MAYVSLNTERPAVWARLVNFRARAQIFRIRP